MYESADQIPGNRTVVAAEPSHVGRAHGYAYEVRLTCASCIRLVLSHTAYASARHTTLRVITSTPAA